MTRRQFPKASLFIAAATLGFTALAQAEPASVTMNLITPDGVGAAVGTIALEEAAEGLVLKPDLKGLPAGEHGFHLHEKPSCAPGEKDGKMAAGVAAGDHYDPTHSGKHLGPLSSGGHRGDLPALTVAADGSATGALVAPYLKLSDVSGRALMIHAGGDNYADEPKPLGGGGDRIACGVIQ
jgi:superoxide dismutase, Cu-Zn family